MQKITDIIFLPGWGFTASIFGMLTPYLVNYRLHLIDLPAQHDNITLAQFAHVLPEHAALAGWSLGGLTAITLCAMFPEKFRQLILLGSTPKFVASDNWPGIHPTIARRFSSTARKNLSATMNDFVALTCAPTDGIKEYLQAHTTQHNASLLTQLDFLFAEDLRAAYTNLSQPILSIAGDKDAILPPTTDSEIISGAGHAFPFTHTENVCRRIDMFVSGYHE